MKNEFDGQDHNAYGIPPHEENESDSINKKEIEIKDNEEGTASPASSIFNLANTTVGAGIVAIPLAVQQSGIILGIISIFIFGLLSSYTLHLLLHSSTQVKKYSFKDLAIEAFGTKIGPFFELAIVLLAFGVCTVFVILISRTFPNLLASWTQNWKEGTHIISNKYLVTSLIMLFVVFPLSSLEKIQFLGFTSFIAIIAILYLVIVVCIRFFQKMIEGGLPTEDIIWVNSDILSILNTFPTLIFAFGSHITLLPMYKELKHRSAQKMSIIISSSTTICIVFYIVIGTTGYLQFANIFPFSDNIIDLYPNSDILMEISKFLIGIVVILSYPLVHYACRSSFNNLFLSRFPDNWIKRLIVTAIIVSSTTFFGVVISQIVIVFGLVMTTAGIAVTFLFPFAIYIKLEKSWVKRIPAIILSVLSVILSIVCFTLAVKDMILGLIGLFK
jgi:amino acid permease